MPIGAKMYEDAAKAEGETPDGDADIDKKEDGPIEGEVVDEDKKEIEWKGFDLPKINKITLHYKGDSATADYE